MRLIDADELKKNNRTAMGNVMVVEKDIDNEPTVKAITIEWIDHYIKRKVKIAGINEEVLYINDMLKSWENENGKE